MVELYKRSLNKLELDQVLIMLADCAGSDEGKRSCRDITPESDVDTVRRMLDETSSAFDLSMQKGFPNFSGLKDVADSLDRANRRGVLQPIELLNVAGVLRCTRTVREYVDEGEKYPSLDIYFQQLKPNKYLEDCILGSILSEDEIADTASPELADIRRHMNAQSSKIKESLQKVISSPAYAKYLRDPIITIRQGRYVVPVKSECKNDIPGLVHDISSTGATFFIEPISVVNANNTLRELEIKEKKEIERILSELSSAVAMYHEDIQDNFLLLIHLDVIFAKARLAYKMNAFPPTMNQQGEVLLRNARHPLIDHKTVIPISVRLGTDFDTIIITGPNTGGKTVTLKTIGLLTLMAECGLHIPAGEGSCLSTFDGILADIGDEQSITQSLSTFSSHMRTIVDIISQCDNRTLVLFDELGAGTDPVEGAALAIAIIEFCRKMGSSVVATTHYAELKSYAMRTKGVINASCEFNVDTLQPTYKLLIGIPGKSNAFEISRKLGLPEVILNNAADLVGKCDKDFEDLLAQLEQQRQKMEAARTEVEILQLETEKIKRKSEEYNLQLQRERDSVLERARLEARGIIEDARRIANAAVDEIKTLKKQIRENGEVHNINQRQTDVRQSLNDAENKLNNSAGKAVRPKPSRDILVGDTVELLKTGIKASVIEINKDGTYQLQAGILKLVAKADEVYLLEEKVALQKKTKPTHSGKQLNMSPALSEIDLRGMDSIEAICVLDRYIDEAMRSNLSHMRVIHGKGTGVLRAAVQQSLKRNKFVKNFRLGAYGEGEDGVTVVELV